MLRGIVARGELKLGEVSMGGVFEICDAEVGVEGVVSLLGLLGGVAAGRELESGEGFETCDVEVKVEGGEEPGSTDLDL